MKWNRFLYVLLLCFCFQVQGQNSEIGVFAGTSYYNGELNPSTPVINQIRPVIGLFYRKNLNKRYSLRIGANYGKLSAKDDLRTTELSSFRKLSFSSDVIDAYGTLELNFLPYQIDNYTTSSFTPYVFIGAAVFRVNPEVSDESSNSSSSTGSTIAPAVPFGAGIKFNFAKNLGISIEWTYKKTFTDRIDGLSETYLNGYQLSITSNNDWYSFLGITLNYKILTQSDHCPGVIN
jgi:opacity protein-like surface antigen